MNISLKPVGIVENFIEDRKEMDPIGVKSTIVINDEFLPGLKHLEENSHIIILSYFHQADKSVLTAYPRKLNLVSAIEKGVFATRSPDRPNPIAISIVRLIEVTDNKIIVENLDAVNGTPVLDIKPYSPGSDAIFSTSSINKRTDYASASEEKLYEYFKTSLYNYTYLEDATLNLGIYSIIKIVRELKAIPDREIIDTIVTDFMGNALDCIYFITKITPGERRIILESGETCNSFIKIKLVSGESYIVKNIDTLSSCNINSIQINKLITF